ncbi:helix-turn-helix domain-containing protein [Azospirillum palustre]
MVTASQVRAARALVDWSQQRLQDETGLSATTIKRMENDKIGPGKSSVENLEKVRAALEAAGVEFVSAGVYQGDGGPGVRLRDARG